ncbi:putative acyl-CoA dehydrogenase [Actinoplanes tereljensis]|uniref:DNA alkylation response protein n=1 Tax=Paractinoplanes tereljensis TaxID=571912 RepID=A0A919TWG9_9ACTN|nr:acyl-CoA dehydrogenase family protein [Actinoplanes tereljensis]GIF25968.1 DNA alkylation response protein [Actinoplanes tereljensis]
MTHEVFNQPPPLVDYDVSADAALLAGVAREGAPWAVGDLHRLGKLAGTAEPQLWADSSNRYPPRLLTHDRYGHRIDEVEFHPSWHQLMAVAVSEGLAGSAWASSRRGAHVARAAGLFVWSQVEAGHSCPISMTYAVVPALRNNSDLSGMFEPLLASRDYDPGLRTPATKRGLLAGMGMTEKQGGSDVRANSTVATPARDGTWRLRGHKWFTSAPMCDLFLVLAQSKSGLSCFMVPRVLPDGSRNVFRIQRLKDKLGNRSNASSEPEFDDTVAWLVGEEGRGVRTIIEMVAMTRLDCVTGSASGMRAALSQAIHHTRHRSAFGKLLADQPAMTNVLADLALESEAATVLAMRLAGAVDRREQHFKRLAIAIGKFWVCKRQPAVVGEALECLGGNGYVEDSGLPRLYRDAPLNSIWEGSGNVQALDVLRTLQRDPDSQAALLAEVTGVDRRIDQAVIALQKIPADESNARRVVERMALVLQASLLVRHSPPEVADAFCASRLDGDWGHTFGTLPASVDTAALVDRAAPA